MSRFTVRGTLAATLLLVGSHPALAANRLFVENQPLTVNQNGQTVTLRCDNDFPLYGFSIAMKYEIAKVRVTATALAADADGAEWQDLKFDNATGDLIIGVVLDFSPTGVPANDNVIPTGTNRALITLTVDVLNTTSTTAFMDYRDGLGTRQIRNIMTNSSAASVAPTLVDLNVPIRFPPSITSFAGNSGVPGKVFQVVGTNFNKAGRVVRVCGITATATLRADNQTLDVTAPAGCGTAVAAVEVCTNDGCDSEANGFTYDTPIPPPAITSLTGNSGQAGKVFQVVGTNFNQPGRVVRVCGIAATATLRPDNQTLDVTAPAGCGTGMKPVEVCTNGGCDTEANGFDYQAAGTPFLRGDANNDQGLDLADAVSVFNDLFLGQPALTPCRDSMDTNDDGTLDLTDGIIILNFLFQGGVPPSPPFPAPGLDTTPDDLPTC